MPKFRRKFGKSSILCSPIYHFAEEPVVTFTIYLLQIVGPFSFRIDSGVAVNLKNGEWHIDVDEPVFAIEYALQVLGSAKAIAWYSPKHEEFMVELRFFET